ncbi:MAG: efflux RND transporter periplasmic adaptor subunit [Bacteroidales bacterium]|nr:efflux RND transporter periplasmic adaptor subunit [Bacteroidales bacterium]
MCRLNRTKTFISGAFLILILITSCKHAGNSQQAGAVSFTVMKAERGEGETQAEFPTVLSSNQLVEIRPRVTGYLSERYVQDGQSVVKGQSLFKIDDTSFKAAISSAAATVAAREADLENAQLEVQKRKPLVANGIISPFELETAQKSEMAAKAQLDQAKAQLHDAKINLGYTLITSPVTGVLGQINSYVGTLVQISDQQPLTTVSAKGDMFAFFSINEADVLDLQRKQKEMDMDDFIPVEVSLRLADGSLYQHKGTLSFGSGLVNQTTGSLLLKATFPNPDDFLRSGNSGIVIIPKTMKNVFLIPKAITYSLQNMTMVFCMDEDNTVHPREIHVVGSNETYYFVNDGLTEGEVLVTEGINRLRDGQKIEPVFSK